MRGYFGFGAEGISKPMNMGNLVRSAHAFGAQFVFTVSAHYSVREGKSDTSKAPNHYLGMIGIVVKIWFYRISVN